MTKEEIALQITLANAKMLSTAHSVEELAQNFYNFYNQVFDNIKTEYSKKHNNTNVLK